MDPEVRAVLGLLDRRLGVDCLWVFGSGAAGRQREDSDLDLGALFRKRPSPVELIETRSEAEALIGRPVDLVDLDEASPLVAWQVLRHGRLVVDRHRARRVRFTAGVPGRREDLLLARRPVEERLIGRATEAGADG